MTDNYIFHDLSSCIGSGESAELTLVTNMKTGESDIKLSMCYSKRYKTSELEQAESDMKALTGGGFVIDIERLVKMRHIDAGLEHLRED